MSGPGAPHCREVAVRRLDGQHSGSTHGDASRHLRSITRKHPRVREGEDGREVLTSGRRCSRGRLGEVGRRGVVVHGVDISGGGRLLAPLQRPLPARASPSFRNDPSGSSRPRVVPGNGASAATRC
jgi:hypothetical protein